MKKLIIAAVIVLLAVPAFAVEPIKLGTWAYLGTTVLKDQAGSTIPDTTVIGGSSSRTYRFITLDIKNLFIDIEMDQAGTVVITPLPDYGNISVEGADSDTCSITANTPARCSYSDISAPRAKVVVTNSSGSALTSYFFTVRGSVR